MAICLEDISKLERFTKVEVSPNLKGFHTWGCPIFALDASLQSGKKINKWNSRARLGVYLGNSPRHDSTVFLVLNLDTGHVSPQFHVQHDHFFETVRPNSSNPRTRSNRQRLVGLVDNMGAHLSKPYHVNIEVAYQQTPIEGVEARTASNDEDEITAVPPVNEGDTPSTAPIVMLSEPERSQTPLRRSGRRRTMTVRMRESLDQNKGKRAFQSTYYEVMHEADYTIQNESNDPISFLAKTDADTMYLYQALREPDRDQFIKAVIREVNNHIKRKHWELIPMSQDPEGHKVLDAVWSMKRKRYLLTRQTYKWKACLSVYGGQQEYAVNYFDTYAHVVT